MFSSLQKVKKIAAIAMVNFSGYGCVPHVFWRQRREHGSGWRGGG